MVLSETSQRSEQSKFHIRTAWAAYAQGLTARQFLEVSGWRLVAVIHCSGPICKHRQLNQRQPFDLGRRGDFFRHPRQTKTSPALQIFRTRGKRRDGIAPTEPADVTGCYGEVAAGHGR